MSKPTIEQVLYEHDQARTSVNAAARALASAHRHMNTAHELLMAIHPGNPTSPYAPERTKEAIAAATPSLRDTFIDALTIDGGHHKQWYLERIADYFGIDLPDHEPGIAP